MRLMFVYYAFEDQGSGQVINGYSRAAESLGHQVVVYGKSDPRIPLNYTLDIASADAVIFIFEFTTYVNRYRDRGDGRLDYVRLLSQIPRGRRVILDGDGNYNDVISVEGDYNHRDEDARLRWMEICDSLTDKICQPTYHPLRPGVRSFLFYAYDPSWVTPSNGELKEYGMLYVGHSKFRWGPMLRVLHAIEPIRQQVGRIGLVGHGWDSPPWWADRMRLEDAYFSDAARLRELKVEVLPPVPFGRVIPWMSRAVFNPILLRPTFQRLRLVTPRMFETIAANTIPVFGLDRDHIREIYGERALPLMLRDDAPHEQLRDILGRPDDYREIVLGIRAYLAKQHSYAARLLQLIEIAES